MRKLVGRATGLVLLLFFAACVPAQSIPAVVFRKPWDVWTPGYDLTGRPLRNSRISAGDNLYTRGDPEAALAAYQEAAEKELDLMEEEALVVRAASSQLALSRAEAARSLLRRYYLKAGRKPETVAAEAALIFGYVYDSLRDNDQSLAWFSHCLRKAEAHPEVIHAALEGARNVLSRSDSGEFERLAQLWVGDQYITELVLKESQMRRLAPSLSSLEGSSPDRFSGDRVIVGLLPLSGRSFEVGAAFLKGLDLALAGTRLRLVVRDSAAEPRLSAEDLRELYADLIIAVDSDGGRAASFLPSGVPRILVPGQPDCTVEEQVEALLSDDKLQPALELYAVLFPDTAAGRKYAVMLESRIGRKPAYSAAFSEDDIRREVPRHAAPLRKAAPAVLVLPGPIRAARVLGEQKPPVLQDNTIVVGLCGWHDSVMPGQEVAAGAGSVLAPIAFDKESEEYSKQFASAFRLKHGVKPEYFAALGFDLGNFILSAVSRKLTEPPADLTAVLSGMKGYSGITGRLTLTAAGDLRRIPRLAEIPRS
jgi:tetratricopeptide (TPR) repeat protein